VFCVGKKLCWLSCLLCVSVCLSVFRFFSNSFLFFLFVLYLQFIVEPGLAASRHSVFLRQDEDRSSIAFLGNEFAGVCWVYVEACILCVCWCGKKTKGCMLVCMVVSKKMSVVCALFCNYAFCDLFLWVHPSLFKEDNLQRQRDSISATAPCSNPLTTHSNEHSESKTFPLCVLFLWSPFVSRFSLFLLFGDDITFFCLSMVVLAVGRGKPLPTAESRSC